MLQLWNVRSALEASARTIEQELQRSDSKRLVVRASTGSGRHSIAGILAKNLRACVVEFPSYDDLDAPLHGLVQAASVARTLESIFDASQAFSSKVREIAAAVAKDERPLVFLLPTPRPGRLRETAAAVKARIDEFVSTAVAYPAVTVIVLATAGHRLRGVLDAPSVELTLPRVGAGDLDPQQLPPRFAQAAAELQRWMSTTSWQGSNPLEARLQVGLVALGERPENLGTNLLALARRMSHQLHDRWRTLGGAVRRMLLARRPMQLADVQSVSGIEAEWLPLLTSCIGYGEETVRVPDVTRQVLLDSLETSIPEREAAHAALALYHHGLDGQRSLRDLDQLPAIHWMEKVHHLALGGEACADQWREQELAGREQIWERARYLSRVEHRYTEAAELYRRCISDFGADAYSCHYLAYNLERGRQPLAEVRKNYAAAVGVDAENPWWQQRWIRFLIAHGSLAEARDGWRAAVRAIDPDGTRIQRSSWLALNLHYGVARRWLALGRIDDARAVLAEVPRRWLEEEAELRDLVRVLSTEEEARVLGESVYPASVPPHERWSRPRSLRPTRGGRSLVFWAPGRVVEATAQQVTIVIAPTREEAEQLSYDAPTWKSIAGELSEEAEGFIEVGRYEGGDEVIRHIAGDGEGGLLDTEEAELSGWVTSWSR